MKGMTDPESNGSAQSGEGGHIEGTSSSSVNLSQTAEQTPQSADGNGTASGSTTIDSSNFTVTTPPPAPPTASIQRQNSTSSNQGDGERRFRFNLDFDSGRRHFQALTMIQEWARNTVSLGIPNLSATNSPDAPNLTERGRLAHRQQSDTQIMIPSTSEHTLIPPTQMTSVPVGHTRLSRGSIGSSPANFRRGSADGNSATNGEGHSLLGSAHGHRDRESLALNIEPAEDWNAGNTTDEAMRRQSGELPPRRTPPSGSSTPSRPPEGASPTTSADILRDSPETRAFIEEIKYYTTLRPFLAIMLLKNLIDHGSGIVCGLALVVTFSHANSLLKKEVSKQRKRNLLFLAMIVINLIGCAGFIYYVFCEEELYYALIFLETKVELKTFWMLIWVVGLTDYIAKFFAIIAKAIIVAVPAALIPFQKRGIYYLFIEQTSQLYRSALPVHHWLLYLINSYEGSMKMLGLMLAGLYTVFKLVDTIPRLKDWNSAFQKLFQNVHYGTRVDMETMDSVICPICHDNFTTPTRLSCTHVFCEECVSTWFDRERTCPLCRAKVVEDPAFRDGSTAQYIQFF